MKDYKKFKREQLRLQSLDLVAQFFKVSFSTAELWVKAGMPRIQLSVEEGTKPRQRYAYQLDDIMEWLLTDGPWKNRKKSESKPLDPDDALLSGPATPELEKLRAVKRKHAELDYAERLRELVAVEDLLPTLHRLASAIRRWVERLSDQYGPKVIDSFDEVLNEFRNVIANEIGSPVQPSEGDAADAGLSEDAEAPLDIPVG